MINKSGIILTGVPTSLVQTKGGKYLKLTIVYPIDNGTQKPVPHSTVVNISAQQRAKVTDSFEALKGKKSTIKVYCRAVTGGNGPFVSFYTKRDSKLEAI